MKANHVWVIAAGGVLAVVRMARWALARTGDAPAQERAVGATGFNDSVSLSLGSLVPPWLMRQAEAIARQPECPSTDGRKERLHGQTGTAEG